MHTKNIVFFLFVFSTLLFNSCGNKAAEADQSSANSERPDKFKNKAKHGEDISIYVDFGISSA